MPSDPCSLDLLTLAGLFRCGSRGWDTSRSKFVCFAILGRLRLPVGERADESLIPHSPLILCVFSHRHFPLRVWFVLVFFYLSSHLYSVKGNFDIILGFRKIVFSPEKPGG